MERLNATASQLAIAHGVSGGTDITGFGLAGHALAVARASSVGIRIDFDKVPTYEAFGALVARGVSTGSTKANRRNVQDQLEDLKGLDAAQLELLFDPQTSGGLFLAVPSQNGRRPVEGVAGIRASRGRDRRGCRRPRASDHFLGTRSSGPH